MTNRNTVHYVLLFISLFGITIAVTSCESDVSEPVPVDAELRKSTFDLVRDDVPKWMAFAAAEQVESASLRAEISRPINELQGYGLGHIAIARTLYATREHRPMWVDVTGTRSGGLNDSGAQLHAVLEGAVTDHALRSSDLHSDSIAALMKDAIVATDDAFTDVRLEAAELKLVREWAAAHPEAKPEDLARAMAMRDGPTPRLAALISERARDLAGDSRARVRLELLLTDALVSYGMQMRWSNDAWTRDEVWPDHLQEPAADTRIGWDELRAARRDVVARRALVSVFDDPTAVQDFAAELVPPYEQYGRLVKAFQTYTQFVDKGGWSPLPNEGGELKVGDQGPVVAALKERLAAEGYWQGDRTERFTQPLADALREYQQTHQLWEKGTLSREARASLNVPAERRLAQIRVALQRWRESNIGADEHYAFVNIPDFHVEVWNAGDRQLRIKSVVGSTTFERDEDSGAHAYVHATPSVSSQIEHVVLNPYWWVPADIVKNEIEPEIAKNPWYLAENHYEWAEDDRGEATLRQTPGDHNALGRVKINFPNDFQIYMHDTNKRDLFRWPARAFSHGCIRLERPMELARYLLDQQDGVWDDAAVQEQLDTGEEKWIKLQNQLPVHIEYYVVRVDDRGRTNFLSDLYRRNLQRMRTAMKTTETAATDP